MEINSLVYKNVYGYLSGKLNFKKGENFLVGINGCGKTTVLNLMKWMLQPSFSNLCSLEHDLITIEIKHANRIYTLHSRITGLKHTYKVVPKARSSKYNPIVTQLKLSPHQLKTSPYRNTDLYENLAPEDGEEATWVFLNEELPTPVFVGLERDVQDHMPAPRPVRRVKSAVSESTTFVTIANSLMRDAFNTSRRKLVELNEALNQEVLKLSFSGIIKPAALRSPQSLETATRKIERLKSRFTMSSDQGKYSKALSSEAVRAAVVNYLENLEGLITGNRSSKDDLFWIAVNQEHFDKASKMFDLFEAHELDAQRAQSDVNNFSDTVNMFLQDSGKEIFFDKNTGAPKFRNEALSNQPLSLGELSSGEIQLIVLLTYFAFLAKEGIPIIIDEPELSIHVAWQQLFVSAVKRLLPEECQTIMATHSPEICGAPDVNVQPILIRKGK